MVGVRCGRLTGAAFSHTSPGGRAHWRFSCDCGGEVVADGCNVRSGGMSSCGCLHREVSAARLTAHGHRAAKRHDATYRAWQGMRADAYASEKPVCLSWAESYQHFLDDMGERPPETVLTLRDPGAGFSRDNCCWRAVRSRARRAADGHQDRRRGFAMAGREGPPAIR